MTEPFNVLLIEDNPGDADLTRETLESSSLKVTLSVVVDGAEALEYLLREGRHGAAPRPDLILLDLNLPKLSGRDVLTQVKRSDTLRVIPVVVLTSSGADRDVVESYNLGANCYITKPVDWRAFQTIVQGVVDFWLTIVKLPSAQALGR